MGDYFLNDHKLSLNESIIKLTLGRKIGSKISHFEAIISQIMKGIEPNHQLALL
jgi:hypothetical protein